jgi:hypothetical protein
MLETYTVSSTAALQIRRDSKHKWDHDATSSDSRKGITTCTGAVPIWHETGTTALGDGGPVPVDEGLDHLPPLLLGLAHPRRPLLLRARGAPHQADPADAPASTSPAGATAAGESPPLDRSGRRAAAAAAPAEDGRLRGDPGDAPGRGLHPPLLPGPRKSRGESEAPPQERRDGNAGEAAEMEGFAAGVLEAIGMAEERWVNFGVGRRRGGRRPGKSDKIGGLWWGRTAAAFKRRGWLPFPS